MEQRRNISVPWSAPRYDLRKIGNKRMWNQTEVSKRLGIIYPIIQGPFGGGLSSTKLLSIVSNAGGLGSYGVHTMESRKIGNWQTRYAR